MDTKMISIMSKAMQIEYKGNNPPAKRGLTSLENMEITRAEDALFNSSQILHVNDSDIRDMLSKIYILLGMKEQYIPCNEETQFLIEFIRITYPVKTIDEIKLAFHLAISGLLELNPNEVKLFDYFSCAYLARIMDAYHIWLKRVYKRKAETIKPTEQKKIIEKPLSEKDWLITLKDCQKLKFDLLPVEVYTHYENKKIRLNSDEKYNYLQKAVEYLDYNLKGDKELYPAFCKMKSKGEFDGLIKTYVVNTAKRMIIWTVLLKKDLSILFQNEKPKKIK